MIGFKSLRAYWITTIEGHDLVDRTLRPAIHACFFEASFRATNLLCPQSHAASLNLRLSSLIARPDAYEGVSVAVHPGSVSLPAAVVRAFKSSPSTNCNRLISHFGTAKKSDRQVSHLHPTQSTLGQLSGMSCSLAFELLLLFSSKHTTA
jgi:hypothetical protein